MPQTRRRLLHLGSVALAASVAGCSGGRDAERSETSDESGGDDHSANVSDDSSTDPTTGALGVDTSLPEGSVAFPDGPKSRPDRPADLTQERVREFVASFERRWVYNSLYRDESTEVSQECGVESVTEYGEGFRAVVWCSASATTEQNGSTYHADYFTQYATYFVGPEGTVRREGRSGTRR